MADGLDVEAMLDAPFRKSESTSTPGSTHPMQESYALTRHSEETRMHDLAPEHASNSHADSRSRRPSRSSSRSRHSSSRRHRREHSRERERDRDRHRRHRRSHGSRSRSPSRDRRRHHASSRRRSPTPDYAGRRANRQKLERPTRPRSPSPMVNEADRDQRTVFVMQLAARLKNSELHDFFSRAGRVRDARIVTDKATGRSKGVAYVEFYEIASTQHAIAMTGEKLLGIPVIAQPTEAEKNRIAAQAAAQAQGQGHRRLYVSQLPPFLKDEDIRELFAPFGLLELVNTQRDPATGQSRGFAFIQYSRSIDANNAMVGMNGSELLGQKIKVSLVNENNTGLPTSRLDETENDNVNLTSQSRHELMQKLATRITDADSAPDTSSAVTSSIPICVTSRAIVLKNMFDPASESGENWEKELQDDVCGECSKFGSIVHFKLDTSEAEIYMKFTDPDAAARAVQGLNQRWFAGQQISASLVPEVVYHTRFPKSASL